MSSKDLLQKEFKNLDLFFDDKFYVRCEQYISLLQEWGAVHNLTKALQTVDIIRNIIDSIYPIKFLNSFESFADIGTGAGYPGVLLCIAKPDVKAVLIEPKAKKVAFLNFVKNSLKLENVEILHKRVQDVLPTNYDLITSRAVTNTSLLLNITKNISSLNTEYLFYKGTLCEKEASLLQQMDTKIINFRNNRNYLYIKRKALF